MGVLASAVVSAAVLERSAGRQGGVDPTQATRPPAQPTTARPPTQVVVDPDPDLALVRVSPRERDLGDGLLERVAFCFSRPVRAAGPADRLLLVGPDVDTEVAATDVDLLVSDARCLLAGFPSGTPVSRYTLGVAERGAARDLESSSVASTAPLGSPRPRIAVDLGGTTGPDLVAVRVDRTLRRIAFVFDEPLERDVALRAPASFRYSLPSGTVRSGTSVVAADDHTVVVAFPQAGLDDAVRVSALPGAVRGRDGSASTPGVKLLSAGGTSAPRLRSVQRVPDVEALFDFEFSAPVTRPVAQRFALYRADSTPLRGTAVARPSPAVVRVLFPGAEDVRPVLAAAAPGAVELLGSPTTANAQEISRLAPYGALVGRTTGPDLVGVRLEADGALLRLLFDQPLEVRTDVDLRDVRLVLGNGRHLVPEAVVQVRGSELLVLVGPSAAAARRVVVARGAVQGRDSEPSAPGSRVLGR